MEVKTRIINSKYTRELQAAIDVVERACNLCLSVQASSNGYGDLVSSSWRLEKGDSTPVTVADFAVQALVSLELGLLFPSIPLVGEEDASQLREEFLNAKNLETSQSTPLVEAVTEAVAKFSSENVKLLTPEKVLDAIDKGGKALRTDSSKSLSYWILDPIDGTRGFLRGGDALYVVGLALVVDGELVLGVMGCPNISYVYDDKFAQGKPRLQMASLSKGRDATSLNFQTGLLLASCTGCGCWVKPLSQRPTKSEEESTSGTVLEGMRESKVDECRSLKTAIFCISDHEVWGSLPLAKALASSVSPEDRLGKIEANVLPLCCGSLCKYFAVALGGASVFIMHLKTGSSVKVWDHAAGVICVIEAGGQVADIKGTPLQEMIGDGESLLNPEGGGIVATNGYLTQKLFWSGLQRYT